jgi:hypothetical protein
MLRPTFSRPVCLGVKPHLEPKTRFLLMLLMWGAISDDRMGLSFTIAAGPRQLRHSWVRVPWDTSPYFTAADSELSQPPTIYIPQGQGGPVIPPHTGFPFRRLLLLAGLRWRYSNPPRHGLEASV